MEVLLCKSPPLQEAGITVISAANPNTLCTHRSTDSRGRDSGHGVLRSGHGGNVRGALRAIVASSASVQPCVYRRVDRGHQVPLRSRCRWSGYCNDALLRGSGRRSSILGDLARSFRHDGSRNGNRYPTYNVGLRGAMYRSERPMMSGRASLPNNE